MVKIVHDALAVNGCADDAQRFLARAVPTLDAELRWWKINRDAADIGSQHLNRYDSNTTSPRPESYLEDVNLAASCPSGNVPTLYRNVAAGAESGWDFSSRWLRSPNNLSTIDTTSVVPVELNAYLLGAELNLYRFHTILGNITAAEKYRTAAQLRYVAMERHLREGGRGWHDLCNGAPCSGIAASNFLPLWILVRPDARLLLNISQEDLTNAADALNESGLIAVAGVRSTTLHTGQQWDSPNAWAPVQHMLVEALLAIPPSVSQGRLLGESWLATNFIAFNRTGIMFEK